MNDLKIGDFREQTLELGSDYEGRVIATVIHSPKNEAGKPSILYLHGFNDYFFQAHVAQKFHEQGYNFYALDLRKYGRSLLPHQHPNYCRSLTEYFEELDQTIQIIQEEGSTEIMLLGHSTGGLIGSYYMNKGSKRSAISRMILNSPFLQFNFPAWQRLLLLPMSGVISFFFPFAAQMKPSSHLYNASILHQRYGEWDFNTDWKPITGFPAYFKWAYAVYRAQKWHHKHSKIPVPLLILHSDQSSRNKKWNNVILKTDMVLNVDDIKKYGQELGNQIEFASIKNAMHDVFLSQKEVRNQAFMRMFEWLTKSEMT